MSNPDMVMVPVAEYERLKLDSGLLDRLFAAGVDNWEGYDMAVDGDDEESYEDIYGEQK